VLVLKENSSFLKAFIPDEVDKSQHGFCMHQNARAGGPLLNYKGQVVGICTAIAQESQGIGFAIPSDTILENIQEIL
jgi:hypothetical protein